MARPVVINANPPGSNEIVVRQKRTYILSDDERTAIEDACKGGFASEQDVAAFWKRHGIR